MRKFNISLLAKQRWRIITQPDSLLSLVFKAKYFHEIDYMHSTLGINPSYVWRSIWATKGVLEKGVCWRVNLGDKISVMSDPWIPENTNFILSSLIINDQNLRVIDLIATDSCNWKKEVIEFTFMEPDAVNILKIPMAIEEHSDYMVWGLEVSGEFLVRSTYKELQGSNWDPSAYAL